MIRTIVWLSAALLASAATASAQVTYVTAEATAGTFDVTVTSVGIRGASYDISGPGVHFVATGVEGGYFSGPRCGASSHCRPGDVFSLNANLTGSYLGLGIAVVEGETMNPAYFSGTVGFVTGELTIPPGYRKHLVMSTPFTLGTWPDTLGATLVVTPASLFDNPPQVRVALSGGGTATAFFERVHIQTRGGRPISARRPAFYYQLVRVIYSFDTAATAQ